MEFFYKHSLLPDDYSLLTEINNAASKLNEKLNSLNVQLLDISDYNKRYLGDYLKFTKNILMIYSHILSWSVAYIDVPLKEFILIEYGGGTGILSFLAKELGIGTVIYNDIYDISCRDSNIIGQAIENEADFYVQGDIDKLIEFLKINSIDCNAIASKDVIEHVYKIEDFFLKLSGLSNNQFNIVMSTHANPYNPRLRKRFNKMQKEVEYKDREKKWGHKERDSLNAYFKIRKEIISNHKPNNLTNREIDRLAKATRGLIKLDIIKYVEKYISTGKFPDQPNHPTNTCDPNTGNWAERLMSTNYLKKLLNKEFDVAILCGYYGGLKSQIKSNIGNFLNRLIFLLNEKGLFFAPFYTVYARKKGKVN